MALVFVVAQQRKLVDTCARNLICMYVCVCVKMRTCMAPSQERIILMHNRWGFSHVSCSKITYSVLCTKGIGHYWLNQSQGQIMDWEHIKSNAWLSLLLVKGKWWHHLTGWSDDIVTSWRGAPIIVSYMPQYSCTLDVSFNRKICSHVLTCTWEVEFSDVP